MNPFLRLGRYTNSVITCGFTGVYVCVKLNNFSKCKQMLEVRRNDPSLVLPPSLNKLVIEVMDEMKLKEHEKSQITIFCSETSDFQHHGSVDSQYGALLGIPQYFLVDQNSDIKISILAENSKLVDEKNSYLSKVMHLSTEAKKFAIARELYELLYSNKQILHTLPLLLNLNCIFLSYLFEKLFKKLQKKNLFILHTVLLLLGKSLYALTFDWTILYTETKADLLACDLGMSYITGGIEYYRKMIIKNKELKKIDKNAPYSIDGDINYSVFGKHHMPLKKRLIYLRDFYNAKKGKPSVWSYIIFVS